jgi:hypothetical protein
MKSTCGYCGHKHDYHATTCEDCGKFRYMSVNPSAGPEEIKAVSDVLWKHAIGGQGLSEETMYRLSTEVLEALDYNTWSEPEPT